MIVHSPRGGRLAPTSYYRYPALKRPEWGWEVILYLFVGGLASGCYLVATLADLFGSAEDRPVARVGRYLALAAVVISPLLLIADLGRRERFTHMLRIVKSRSPMSMGTWGLSGFALFVVLGALRQAVEDGLVGRRSPLAQLLAWVPLSVSGVLGSLFAFFVGSYTGVLLSFTNTPLWARNHLLQGPLFVTSALSTGLAAISLTLGIRGHVPPRTQSWLSRAETTATVGEMGLIAGSLLTLGPLARPLVGRPYAMPFWLGAVFLGLIFPQSLRRKDERALGGVTRARHIVASLSVLLGGLIFRWVTVEAGKMSAQEPLDYLTSYGAGTK